MAEPTKAQLLAKVAALEATRERLEARAATAERTAAEAVEQQTATAEVLRLISSSSTDLQLVFASLVASAARLGSANDLLLLVREADVLHPVAGVGSFWESMAPEFRVPLVRGSVAARSVLDGTTLHFPDLAALSETEFSMGRDLQRRFGHHTVLAVPLVREGVALGTIFAMRFEIQPFSEKQIALLKTFADQAVIAIENARLLSELQEKNASLSEALDRQTATADVLRIIAQSPNALQPVLDAIAASAARLCAATDVVIERLEGDRFYNAAHAGTQMQGLVGLPLPFTRAFPGGRAVLDRRRIVVDDIHLIAPTEYPDVLPLLALNTVHSVAEIPLLSEGKPLGSIAVLRAEVRPFTEPEIALLETFADQAVIAIENVRLFTELQTSNRELTSALDTQTATSDILRVISRSQTDVQPVFEAIMQSAVRLLRGQGGSLTRTVGHHIEIAALAIRDGDATAEAELRAIFPLPLQSEGMHAMAIRTRVPVNVADAHTDSRLLKAARTHARARGYHSLVVVPLLRHDEAVGTIAVSRIESGGFTDDEVALLQTFADQAVIAIENARLLTELQARTQELTCSVDQLTALGDVGRAVSSSLDLDTVLTTIVGRAVELSGTDGGTIFEYDASAEEFTARATLTADQGQSAMLRTTRLHRGEGAVGQMAVTREPFQIPDIAAEGAYESRVRGAMLASGTRSVLAIPLLHENHLVGGLVVTRRAPGEFEGTVVELLRTFATQSALAIQNARLFRQLEIKSRELEVASQHKSEFLASMSHELRTPLNAIIGFSDVLLQGMFGETNEKQTEYLRDILASGEHLLSLINDILDLSKIEAGRMELDVAAFDLPTAIDDAMLLMRERASRRDLTLERHIGERVGEIRGDQRKVKQVLLNLLSNAVKFTPDGGRIDVRAELTNRTVEISVTDTGIGIAAEDHDAVFEEFRQVGKADKKAEGTGLGLALCRKFVELHGGRIWLSSALGKGSTFSFTIPV